MKRLRLRLRRVRRTFLKLLAIALCIPTLWALAYRWVDPPTTYLIMVESYRLGGVEREWRSLDEISPHMPRAAMGGEDANFCSHWAFDIAAIRAAMADSESRRGASTITQQVAKNVFLWPDASWLRKGLEAGFAVLIEAFWSKQRIMEVYLNVAEMGEGVFGVEAAAQRYFGRPARDLTLDQAARIAAILPNPKARNPARLAPHHRRRARAIADGAETLRRDNRAACVRPLPLAAQRGS